MELSRRLQGSLRNFSHYKVPIIDAFIRVRKGFELTPFLSFLSLDSSLYFATTE